MLPQNPPYSHGCQLSPEQRKALDVRKEVMDWIFDGRKRPTTLALYFDPEQRARMFEALKNETEIFPRTE